MSLFKKKEEYEGEVPQTELQGTQVVPPGGVTLTVEQLKDLFITAVQELRKPTAEEMEKAEREKQMRLRAAEARVEVGRAAERERVRNQATCNHKMDNGRADKLSAGGQLHSDGKVHIFCLRCQKEISVYNPSPVEMAAHLGR